MRKLLIAAALVAAAIPAMAQQSPPANRDANTPAVNTPNSPPNPGAPVAGANSFTEGQAKSRIEAGASLMFPGSRRTAMASGAAQPPRPASPSTSAWTSKETSSANSNTNHQESSDQKELS